MDPREQHDSLQVIEKMVGAIGFEPNPHLPFQPFAGLGWQPKDRNGSQRNNYWTRIGHCRLPIRAPSGTLPQNRHHSVVLSSVLKSAVEYEMLIRNPMLAVQIPRAKIVNKHKAKPYLTPEEFDRLLVLVDEPYASMIYVAVHSGLRVLRPVEP